eukprot:NODE_443_length_8546_cov_0.160057.p1 type:complete len:1171 gc:universal NODE_443_length_8546_cov_0.160057:4919-8431(+)
MPRIVSLVTTEIIEARIREKQQLVYASLSGTSNNYDQDSLYQNISTPYQNGGVYWASKHEFEHDSQRGAFPDYLEVKLYNSDRKDTVIGKTLVPRILLTQEQICGRTWFPCSITETASGYGSIRFSVVYTPPAAGNSKHVIVVKIVECKKLNCSIPSMKPSPYVVVSMLPDPKGLNMTRTTVISTNENPKFNETLTFRDDKFDADNEIAIFVFGQLANELDIHGHVRIPLSIIKANEKFEREMPLSPIINLSTDKRVRSSLNSMGPDSKFAHMQEKNILKKFHSSDFNSGKSHKWQNQYAPSAVSCVFCLGMIPKNSNVKSCSECRGTCHRVCSKYCVNSCGYHTMVQLNFLKEDLNVYKFENYMRFFKNLVADNFLLVNIIEKNREEASRALIKICDSLNCAHEYLNCLLKYEINLSENLGTLFRNNSMASKSVEVFFKYHGMGYLKEVLKDPITEFLRNDSDGELDPTRLDNPAEQSPKNLANLMALCDSLMNSILSKQDSFPKPLQGVLHDVSGHVMSRFSDPTAVYSALAGFVFLRYIAPAILGPNLFELTKEFINEKKKRSLTLAAKTIQNLANLTIFGKKEPFMIPMNQFLEPRIAVMTKYLDSVSMPVTLREAAYGKKMKRVDAEAQLAIVADIVRDAIDRGVKDENLNKSPVFIDLVESVKELEIPRLIDYDIPNIQHLTVADSPMKSAVDAPVSAKQFLISKSLLLQEESNPSLGTRSILGHDSAVLPADDFERTMSIKSHKNSSTSQSQRPSVVRKLPRASTVIDQEALLSLTMKRGQENDRKQSVNYDLFIPVDDSLASANMSRQLSKDNEKSNANSRSSLPIVEVQEVDKPKGVTRLSDSRLPSDAPKTSNLAVEQRNSSRISQVVFDNVSIRSTAVEDDKRNSYLNKNDKSLKSLFSVIETAVSNASQFESNYQGVVICNECKSTIQGEYLVIDGRSFHVHHFVCTVCSKDGRDGAKLFNDKLYCIDHYLEYSKDKVCFRCDQVWNKGESIVKALDSLWHSTCFTCAVCDCALNTGFIPHEGLPYCLEHYKRFVGLVCDGCGLILDNEYLTINDMKYHKACRTCKVCSNSIANKKYVIMNEYIYCHEHFDAALSCTRCKDNIKEGEYISIPMRDGPLVFHSDHFTCELCSVYLTPKTYYLTQKSNVRCRKCIFEKYD